MTTTPSKHNHDRTEADIRVVTRDADPNDLAGATLRWLTSETPRLGSERATITLFSAWMKSLPPGTTLYANPIARVTAVRISPDFLRIAREQQRRWIAQLNSWLCSAERVKRFYASAHPIIRQLELTGVMIADGNHVRPNQWPSTPTRPASESLVGRVFGLLTVTADPPGQQCQCQCRCGAIAFKRKKHLIAGRTKSCGCLAAARANALDGRRTNRGRAPFGEHPPTSH